MTKTVFLEVITCAAVESGFIIRSRKIFPVDYLFTLTFEFFSKEEPNIS